MDMGFNKNAKLDTGLLFMRLQYTCQVLLSIYGFRASALAISNLKKYEEMTKKAAKWSTEVEQQLFKTRTTQSSGAAAVILSFLSSTTLLFFRSYLNTWVGFSMSPLMLIVILLARNYIKNFWAPRTDKDGKDKGTKVPPLPNMEDYNIAVRNTEDLLKVLEYLEYSWLITSFVTGVTGF